MIQVTTSIHDRFSVEFKINFSSRGTARLSVQDEFLAVCVWIALVLKLPLYSKEKFYFNFPKRKPILKNPKCMALPLPGEMQL